MESRVKQQRFRCACRKTGLDYPCFEKILESEDVGLNIYKYVSEAERNTCTRTAVFVFHNSTDNEISTQDIQKALEYSHFCPRCMHMYKRARKLIKNVTTIDKRQTVSICDHCVKKVQAHLTRCKCDDIVKQFLSYSTKQYDAEKREIKLWLNKVQEHLSESNTIERKQNWLRNETHTESPIGKDSGNLRRENQAIRVICSKNENQKISFTSTLADKENLLATRNLARVAIGRDLRSSNMGEVSLKQNEKIMSSTPLQANTHSDSHSSDYNFGKPPRNANEVSDEKEFRYSFPMQKLGKTPIVSQVTSSDLEEAKIKSEKGTRIELKMKNIKEENKKSMAHDK